MRLWAILLLLIRCVASRRMQPPPASVYTSTEPQDLFRTYQVRVAAVVCSGVSTVTSLLALYWFFRMDKRFRHHLIVILFYGGLVSSTSYFAFTAMTTVRGPIPSEATSCQVSGFFIQYGTETCDYAVLVIAIHSAMQVFNPCPPATTDGLRPYRRCVYAGALLLPVLMSCLAFANPHSGYQSLGAYCMLPIRPFWYRLALQWIPRYLIALVIFILAASIYIYVGFAFRRYATTSQSFGDSHLTYGISSSREERDPESPSFSMPQHTETVVEKPTKTRRASSIAHEAVSSTRKGSSVAFVSAGLIPVRAASITPTSTYSVPEKIPDAPPQRPSLALIPSGYTIHRILPPGTGHIVTPQRPPITMCVSPPLSPNQNQDQDPFSISLSPIIQPRAPSPNPPGHRQMDRQRVRIQRQLRLLFIYPLIYPLMWLLPFAMHCMNYQDKYALRPVWFLRLSSTILMTSMGFVNFIVFSAREQPWKTIPTSDGTFWGSFAVWKGRGGGTRVNSMVSGGGRMSVARTISDGPGGRIGQRLSGSTSDAVRMAMGQARVRLEMERVERLEAMRERVARREGVGSEGDSGDEIGGVRGVGGKGKERVVDV
ncbi:hypothetical protein T440DRAFT_535796 [Plenodomus tracheiphilus IPT5]|uniref:Glucose receptor Git3 N-terminal domain-containing protein n=1 Tax=Plenodomus tracheiphilus IPT5 TaxID=1408161 RepID=A0A6A7BJX1_9PLEO|nr:hypothetical protein T440DRAFT_535796 [Plenodomus tracheiphilus IPT5]